MESWISVNKVIPVGEPWTFDRHVIENLWKTRKYMKTRKVYRHVHGISFCTSRLVQLLLSNLPVRHWKAYTKNPSLYKVLTYSQGN